MKLSIGADERLHVVDAVLEALAERGADITWYGPEKKEETALWPEIARLVAEDVAVGHADEGILFCWTGTGVSLAANKIPGIRAALCADAETARGARLWNNANILCLSLRTTSEVIAKEILDAWFNTTYQPNPTDDACLAEIERLDSKYRS